jgi:hypothetical protein
MSACVKLKRRDLIDLPVTTRIVSFTQRAVKALVVGRLRGNAQARKAAGGLPPANHSLAKCQRKLFQGGGNWVSEDCTLISRRATNIDTNITRGHLAEPELIRDAPLVDFSRGKVKHLSRKRPE